MLVSFFSHLDLCATKERLRISRGRLVEDFGEWHIEVNLIDGEHRNLLSVV